MLRSIYLKAIRDRWLGITVAAAAIALTNWMGVAAYKGIDEVALEAFDLMPEAFRELMGFDTSLGTTGMIFSEMVSSMVPLVLIGVLIAMAADAVAGEERWGTINVLLANPRGRRRLVAEKAGAFLTLTAVGCLLMWGGYYLVIALVGEDGSGMFLGSSTIHLAALALFIGGLTFLVGSWTASTLKAAATGTTVMIVSFFGAGLLPMTTWGGPWAKVFPWYYFDGAEPFSNGVAWDHVALLAGPGLAFLVLAAVVFERRDLKVGEERTTILDRLARNPRFSHLAERVAGRAMLGSITAKTTSEARTVLTIVGMSMFYMGAMIGPIFKGVGDKMSELVKAFPEEIMAMVGGADYGSPAGFYHGEIFSIVGPVAVAVLAIGMASRALAGEERERTMGVLLANPVSRTRVVLAKAWAMVLMVAAACLVTYLGVWTGSWLGGSGLSLANIAAVCTHLAVFSVFIGTVALFVGALTGVSRAATSAATLLMIASYAVANFLPLSPTWGGWAKASPFHYYASHLPLENGFAWGYLGILTAASAAFVGASVWAFRRRDLKG
ncbi:MAG: ABC transporter permease subunit [Demequinaceae bacterium]|nr:ABC transporter permease subunit [Demequinaceae bacterium]